jgi:hypothetical protein
MNNSIVLIVSHITAAVFGGCLVYLWFRNDINRLTALQKPGRWETPEEFKERNGYSLPGEAAVYCRWKRNGRMYKKLKELSENNIVLSPDTWTVHTYFTALSIGKVHGEFMEILCADSDMGYPPPKCQSPASEMEPN